MFIQVLCTLFIHTVCWVCVCVCVCVCVELSSLYILHINCLLDTSFANTFSHLLGFLFVLLIYFAVKKAFAFFLFCFPCLRRHTHKYVAKADVQEIIAYILF